MFFKQCFKYKYYLKKKFLSRDGLMQVIHKNKSITSIKKEKIKKLNNKNNKFKKKFFYKSKAMPNILLASNHREIQHVMSFLFLDKYRLTLTDNGTDALELIFTNEDYPFDLIILDWRLSDIPSLMITKNIREMIHGKFVPIILLSDINFKRLPKSITDIGISSFISIDMKKQKILKIIEKNVNKAFFNDFKRGL